MKTIFENVIHSGNYKLIDMQRKIKQACVEGDIGEAEKAELLTLAANNVNANGEKPDDDARFASLLARIEKLEAEVFGADEGAESTEYPVWKPWDGISKDYKFGARVTHGDFVWESAHPGQNVWEPGTPGTENMWVKVEE